MFNFAQTGRNDGRNVGVLGRGATGELPMSDMERYRVNAAECLSAAERSNPPYRRLTFAIAASWLSLARHEEAMYELLGNWSEGSCPHTPLPLAGGYVAMQVGCDAF
jgi:hypothetical protein